MSPCINRNWYWSLFPITDSEIQKGLATAKLTKNRTEWLKAANGAEILSDVQCQSDSYGSCSGQF